MTAGIQGESSSRSTEEEVARERAEIEVELLGVSTSREGGNEAEEVAVDDHLEVEEQGGNPEEDLGTYQLARDRERRMHRAPTRYGYSDLVAFALVTVEELEDSEPKSFREAVAS